MARRVAGERSPDGRATGYEDGVVGATRRMRSGERRIEHKVAQAGWAVVDGGDSERRCARIRHACAHHVTDLESAFGRDHLADSDGQTVHVTQATARDAKIQCPVGRGRDACRRPRRVPAEAAVEQEDVRLHHADRPVDAGQAGELGDAPGGQRCVVAPDHDVISRDPRRRHPLGLPLRAGLQTRPASPRA